MAVMHAVVAREIEKVISGVSENEIGVGIIRDYISDKMLHYMRKDKTC